MKKNGLTNFARGVVYLLGAAVLIVCFILVPELSREEGVGKPFNPYLTYSFFTGMYLLAFTFFVSLYQTLKLLHYIDKNKAFSKRSIKALRNIKICAIISSILIAVSVVTVVSILKSMDPGEDMPPFLLLGFMFTFASTVVAVFVSILQKLLSEAVALKSENDLIV